MVAALSPKANGWHGGIVAGGCLRQAPPMETLFLSLALFFLLGLSAHWLGIKTRLPRVTLLIVAGIAIGPSGLNLFAPYREQWFPVISDIAMVMLGFLIGGSLTLTTLRRHGRAIIAMSVLVALGAFVTVLGGLLLLGQGLAVAVLLAAIATATDPAATTDVLAEQRRQQDAFGQRLTGIVALDDAWGLLVFSLCLVIVTGANGGPTPLLDGLREIAGALLLGVAIGLPMAFLTGRIKNREPILIEALGLVFLCGGLALRLDVSPLLSAIVMGATVANLARHHIRPFRAIEGIEWPFLVLFFILAGASLKLDTLLLGGALCLAYILLRSIGKVVGGWLGGRLCRLGHSGGWTGLALLPQAGVAVAIALNASQAVPDVGELLLTITLASTAVFELVGPIATRLSLARQPADR